MTMKLTLTPQPIKGARGWFVRVVFPDGREKRISRFSTQVEAEAWIANESDDWLAGSTRDAEDNDRPLYGRSTAWLLMPTSRARSGSVRITTIAPACAAWSDRP